MGPQVGFQVKEEVRMGLGFDWAVVRVRVAVRKERILGRDEYVEGEKARISWSRWDKGSDLYRFVLRNVGS